MDRSFSSSKTDTGRTSICPTSPASTLRLQSPLCSKMGASRAFPPWTFRALNSMRYRPALLRPGARFVGKWELGEGNGGNFYATLDADGEAHKSKGSSHGTWTVVGGEARISWDDGWHDAIRKVDGKYEKFAYEPGKSFDDTPSNVTAARNTQAKPI